MGKIGGNRKKRGRYAEISCPEEGKAVWKSDKRSEKGLKLIRNFLHLGTALRRARTCIAWRTEDRIGVWKGSAAGVDRGEKAIEEVVVPGVRGTGGAPIGRRIRKEKSFHVEDTRMQRRKKFQEIRLGRDPIEGVVCGKSSLRGS